MTSNDDCGSTRSLERQRQRLVARSAKGILDDEQIRRLWKGVDIVGDIAILRLPRELGGSKSLIAQNLLGIAPCIKVVLEQIGPVESLFRTRRLEWLAGEKRSETVHREFGCKYRVDLNAVYFSPRLSYERKRITDLVCPGECVVNFFAGLGSFSVMIARHAHPSRVYSLDVSLVALRYHLINNALNGVHEIIDLICGDANRIVPASLVGCADRVLLPLPELAIDSLPTAKTALRNGHGIVHCYVFVDASRREEARNKALLKLDPFANEFRTMRDNTRAHVVRSVGPCRYQVCLDVAV